jgi:hypothetical protein
MFMSSHRNVGQIHDIRWLMKHSEMWQISNVCEQQRQIKIELQYITKLRAD